MIGIIIKKGKFGHRLLTPYEDESTDRGDDSIS